MSTDTTLLHLAALLALGSLCTWVAWRTRLPSILYFILAGVLVGPVFRLVPPEPIFGSQSELMIDLVLAFILFEGGLSLRFDDIREKPVVHRLLTLGLAVTLVLSTIFAKLFLQVSWSLALLLGSILMVTGPTVIVPLLQNIRLKGQLGNLLLWEGMFNDSIAAMTTVIVLDAIVYHHISTVGFSLMLGIIVAVVFSSVLGAVGAFLYSYVQKQRWFPQYLSISALLSILLMVYAMGNMIQEEGGLLAVTVLGMVLGNIKQRDNRKLMEFTLPIQQVLIAAIFLLLVSPLTLQQLTMISWRTLAFIAALIFVVRPLSVFISFIGVPHTTFNEKLFMGFTAPRGVVAAAVASLIGHLLMQQQYPDSETIVPTIVWVVAITCTFYSLLCPFLARWLNLNEEHPQGILVVGINPFTLSLSKTLKELNIPVQLIDDSSDKVRQAIFNGIPAICRDILSARDIAPLNLGRFKYMLAATTSNKMNTLANHVLSWVFPSGNRFQLYPENMVASHVDTAQRPNIHGHFAFYPSLPYPTLASHFTANAHDESKAFDVLTVVTPQSGATFAKLHPDVVTIGVLYSDNGFVLVSSNFSDLHLNKEDRLIVIYPSQA